MLCAAYFFSASFKSVLAVPLAETCMKQLYDSEGKKKVRTTHKKCFKNVIFFVFLPEYIVVFDIYYLFFFI